MHVRARDSRMLVFVGVFPRCDDLGTVLVLGREGRRGAEPAPRRAPILETAIVPRGDSTRLEGGYPASCCWAVRPYGT